MKEFVFIVKFVFIYMTGLVSESLEMNGKKSGLIIQSVAED